MDLPPADIVVVTHFFPSHGGGIEMVAARLVDQYLKSGYSVAWFASATDDPPAEKGGLRVYAVSAGNLVERATQLPYPLWTPAALPMLWRSIRQARAVHVHEHLYLGSLAAILIGAIQRKRVVLTQHMGALILPSRWATTLYTGSTKVLAAPIMRLASRVAFVSANVMRFFAGHAGLPPGRMLVFNGLDAAMFRHRETGERLDARTRLGLDPDARVILFAGRFVRKKGLDLLREIAGRMPDTAWLFAGSGPANPGLWRLDNVRVLGRLSQTELSKIYGATDVLILPSTGEGFPLVAQEALACGAAVLSTGEVASACPEAAHLIEAEELRNDGSDAARWEAHLRRTLGEATSPALRQHRSEAATALWSWERCATTYLQLLGLERD